MNEYGVLTTYSEVLNHNGSEYQFPDKEEVVDARLDFRAWGKKWSLGCYFTTLDDNRKLLLNAWAEPLELTTNISRRRVILIFQESKITPYGESVSRRIVKADLPGLMQVRYNQE